MVTVGEITGFIETFAPLGLAEPWDRVGLQIGRTAAAVNGITVCLDVTKKVISGALAGDCRMVVSHHPLIFRDFKNLTDASASGLLALSAAEAGLAVYAAHTNLDKGPEGINDALADSLGLADIEILEAGDNLYKLVVFVPEKAIAAVRTALGNVGAGTIGLYSHCSFSSRGIGAFRPGPKAMPHEGKVGKDNLVEECRLEVEVGGADIDVVVKAMLEAHPYEEVAYDLYELRKRDKRNGLGRVGNIPEIGLSDFIDGCIRCFGDQVRFAGPASVKIRRVAVCGGSGAGLAEAAANSGADVLVTGDVSYHDALKAIDMGLIVIDAGHDATEIMGMKVLAKRLGNEFKIKVQGIWPKILWSD